MLCKKSYILRLRILENELVECNSQALTIQLLLQLQLLLRSLPEIRKKSAYLIVLPKQSFFNHFLPADCFPFSLFFLVDPFTPIRKRARLFLHLGSFIPILGRVSKWLERLTAEINIDGSSQTLGS